MPKMSSHTIGIDPTVSVFFLCKPYSTHICNFKSLKSKSGRLSARMSFGP